MNRKEDLYAIDLTGATWRKSPASNTNDHCVEIADLPDGGMAVRDSKNPHRPDLRYTADEWAAFRTGIINGTL
ncbi:DUF397 domain-containing protein [Streptomyces olivoreticuli]|uniref:DUF397 domain-containing protein n=1 Tax=Streptomyces olivoreticuli TaxID=68246 RepID=UPI00265ADCA3|nr:DUF397 domain-containing protein [Streptomyces olivoreticuli]WKK22192.1 DUF397 domain-containing protein [Streptomyces olivoreticuli]